MSIRDELRTDKEGSEQTFTIQPHDATTNDPSGPKKPTHQPNPHHGPSSSSGDASALAGADPAVQAHHARPPHFVSEEIASGLEQPKGRDELRARAAELNK